MPMALTFADIIPARDNMMILSYENLFHTAGTLYGESAIGLDAL